LLKIEGFGLWLKTNDDRILPVLEDISLQLGRGKCLGLVGESGSGKSILALSIMGLVPRDIVSKVSGSIEFDNTSIIDLPEHEMRKIRGKRVSIVFQEPMTAMNPLMTLYEQIAEVIRAHEPNLTEKDVACKVNGTLINCGFAEPGKFVDSFPHQLSGGMRQRAMLAMALVLEPDLIIADEPTTALDAGLQVQLLAELRDLVKKKNHGMIFISHDLGVIQSIADSIAILYAGQVMEIGNSETTLKRPLHPYTHALVESMPRLIREKKLPHPIPGHLPSPDRKPAGCVFSDRCPRAKAECRASRIPLTKREDGRSVRCLFPMN